MALQSAPSCFDYIDVPVSPVRLAEDSLSTPEGRNIVKADKSWLRRQRWRSYLSQAKSNEEQKEQNAAIRKHFPGFTDDDRSTLLSQDIDARASPPGSEQSSLSHSETTKSGLSELSSATASTRVSAGVDKRREDLQRDAKRRFNPMYLDVRPNASLKEALEAVMSRSSSPVATALSELCQRMQPDKQRNTQVRAKRAEDAVAHFAEQVRVALADQEGGLAWLRDVKAVSQGSITVKSSILSDGKQDSDKPDLIYVRVNNGEHSHHGSMLPRPASELSTNAIQSKSRKREVYDWSAIHGVGEVGLNVTADMSEDTESQLLLRAHSFLQEHRRTIQLHLLSICGLRVRLWTIDALSYRTSPAYSLAKKEHLVTIAGFFALMASPWAYSEWSLDTISVDESIVGAANGAPIAWELIPDSTRTSLFGRKTACWSTPVKDSARSLILKAAWLPPHLQWHEGKILETVCRVAREKQRESLPDLLVMVKPRYADCRPWLDNSDADEGQRLSLVIIVTRHYIGETIVYNSDLQSQRNFLQLYAELYQTLLDLAEVNLHYRDINAGNALRRRKTLNRLCFHDFDRARIGMQARGDQSMRLTPFGTAVDDARSATGWFAPVAFAICKQKQISLGYAEAQLQEDRAQIPASIADVVLHLQKSLTDQVEQLAIRKQELLIAGHRFIDDIESSIYLQLYQIIKGGGGTEQASLSKFVREFLGEPSVKVDTWLDPHGIGGVTRKYEQIELRFRILYREMRDALFRVRSALSGMDPTDGCFEQILPIERKGFLECMELVNTLVCSIEQEIRGSAAEQQSIQGVIAGASELSQSMQQLR